MIFLEFHREKRKFMIKIRNTLYENGDAEIKITPYYPNNKGTVRSDEDRISARNRQRKKRAKDHAMSFKATNFLTLTAPEDSPLRTDINTFMKLADKFLATQEVNYFLYPQFYRGTNEYHIHGLSNGAIDFKKWIELTNANPNNCYCKPLEKSQLDAAEYIIRDYGKMPKGLRPRVSNVKACKAKSSFQIINDETGEILSDTSCGSIPNKNQFKYYKEYINNTQNHNDNSNAYDSTDSLYNYDENYELINNDSCILTSNKNEIIDTLNVDMYNNNESRNCHFSSRTVILTFFIFLCSFYTIFKYLKAMFSLGVYLFCNMKTSENESLFIPLPYLFLFTGKVCPYDSNAPPS